MSYLSAFKGQIMPSQEETTRSPEPIYPGLERARIHSKLHSTRLAIKDGENAISFGYFTTGILAAFYLIPSVVSTTLPMFYPEYSPDPNLHIAVSGAITALGVGVVCKGIASIVNGHKDVRENTPKEQKLIQRLEKFNQSERDRTLDYNLSVLA